jgi:hypothetical protein
MAATWSTKSGLTDLIEVRHLAGFLEILISPEYRVGFLKVFSISLSLVEGTRARRERLLVLSGRWIRALRPLSSTV